MFFLPTEKLLELTKRSIWCIYKNRWDLFLTNWETTRINWKLPLRTEKLLGLTAGKCLVTFLQTNWFFVNIISPRFWPGFLFCWFYFWFCQVVTLTSKIKAFLEAPFTWTLGRFFLTLWIFENFKKLIIRFVRGIFSVEKRLMQQHCYH